MAAAPVPDPSAMTPADLFGKRLDKPERTYLVQKFARLRFGPYTVIGYSVAGEETVIQIPELNVTFDAGRAPPFALTSDLLCISHAHMDHLAGIAYYLSQKIFQGMKPATVLCHDDLLDPIDELLGKWRKLEKQEVPYDLVGMLPGDTFDVRRDLVIHTVRTHHGSGSLGYVLVEVRQKLRPEYLDLPGEKIAELRANGTDVHYKLEAPIVAFLGDTAAGPVFENDLVRRARILITECTFFGPEHRRKAKFGKHLHAEQLAEYLPNLQNEAIVIGHVSRRTGVGRAKKSLAKLVGPSEMDRIHFLMDLADSRAEGDVEDALGSPDE
jgi:ribonuclease Z